MGVRRAFTVEAMKMRRAPVIGICSMVILLAPTLLTVAAVLALRSDGRSSFAQKAAVMIHGSGWEGYLGVGAQVMAVAVLLSLGFGFAWSFGREFTDGTIVGLFALPIGRGRIALAKCLTLFLWSVLLSLASTPLLLGGGVALGSMGEHAPRWWLPLGVCLLTACNTVPLAWVATTSRGYLAAIGGLLGLVVATQLITSLGGGGWFPWAMPAWWAGFAGAGHHVRVVQFFLPVLVAVVFTGLTVRAWHRLQLGNA